MRWCGGVGYGLLIGVMIVCAAAHGAEPGAWAGRAVGEAEAIPDARLRLAVYRELMPLLGRVREGELVERLATAGVRLARDAGDRVGRAEVCAAASVAYALAGRREPHERWMLEAITAGAWQDRRLAWPALARARLDGGDADGAGQLATALDTATDRAACLADLAGIAARQGDKETAFDFLRLAMGHVKGADRPEEALARMADAQAQIGDHAGAEATLAAIGPGYWRAHAAGRLAQVAALAGDSDYWRYSELAVRAAIDGGQSPTARAQALLAIARMRADATDSRSANALTVAARAQVALAPAGERPALELAVAGVLSRTGDRAGAAEAARAARDGFAAGVPSDLAAEDGVASLVAGGLLTEAQTAAAAIIDPAVRGRALGRVAAGYEQSRGLNSLVVLARELDSHGWEAARVVGRAHVHRGRVEELERIAKVSTAPAVRSGLWAGAAEAQAMKGKDAR